MIDANDNGWALLSNLCKTKFIASDSISFTHDSFFLSSSPPLLLSSSPPPLLLFSFSPTHTHHQFAAQPSAVSEETQELLTRVAGLQQEKWELEERVGGESVRFVPTIAVRTCVYTTYVSL